MSTLIADITIYGPVVIAAASAAANAVNAALPSASTNGVWKTVHAIVDFLALNWVAKKP